MVEQKAGQGPDLTNLSIEEAVSFLVDEQRKKLPARTLHWPIFNTWRGVPDWFENNQLFKDIYLEALRFNLIPRTAEEIEANLHHLSGRVFQEMAFDHISASFAKGDSADKSFVVLSPERTLLFWQKINPKNKLIKNPFGLDSLDVSTPDGLVIQENPREKSVFSICEYSLTGGDSYFQTKYDEFCRIKDKFQFVFADTRLLFVLPEGYYTSPVWEEDGVRLTRAPLDRDQLRHSINYLYHEYQPDQLRTSSHTAPLSHVQQRAQEFHRRVCQRREKRESLTPEIEKYLSKVGRPKKT